MSALRLRGLDVVVEVAVGDDVLRDHLATLTAALSDGGPATSEAPGAAATVQVEAVGRGRWSVVSPSGAVQVDGAVVVDHVLAAVNAAVVGGTRTLAVHAAVVARGGTTLALPAASGTGKTTLTAALLAAGWEYVSDEALGLTWDAHDEAPVLAYPRPLSVSRWSAHHLGEPLPEDGAPEVHLPVRWPVRRDARPPTHVLLPCRDGSAVGVAPLHRADVVAAMLRRGFTHHRAPRLALRRLADTARSARVGVLHLGDPRATADLVGTWVDGGDGG